MADSNAPDDVLPSTGDVARPVLVPPLVLLDDLTRQLIWPGLLRVPAAALWPSRLMLGVLAALGVGLVGSLSALWSSQPSFLGAVLESQGGAWTEVVDGMLAASPGRVAAGVRSALVASPTDLVGRYPVSTPMLGLLMLGIVVGVGGAIARSVAEESAGGGRPPAARMLGWSLARWPSALAATAAPLGAIWLLLLTMRALGWIGLSLPGVDVAAGVLFPAQMVLGMVLIGLALVVGLGGAMVVPARMVEDSDAIDALQRAAAYLIARPLRVLVFVVIAFGIAGVALDVARVVVGGGWSMALEASGAWLTDARRAALSGAMPPGADGTSPPMPPTTRATHWLVGLWGQVPALLIGGYAISLFFTAGTRVYLAARRVCDGQDQADIQGASGRAGGAGAGVNTPDAGA